MTLSGNWTYPTAIRFGAGRVKELPEACRAAGIHRPLLITDRALAKMGITQNAAQILKDADMGGEVFGEADSNPSEADVAAGLEAFRGGNFDGVVAFGGGSALDVGKAVAFMRGQTRPLWDFEDVEDWWTRANASAIAPVVAVPTTAGTGSEVGRSAVIVNSETQEKKIIFHPKMLPVAVIADAELTAGMPPAITAGTGLDAFAHCVEGYCSPHYHPMSQGIALEGMRLVKENLPRAFKDGNDLTARAHMMAAATMGATAFQKGLGAIHALSHPIGARHHTHHGATNAVCMPAVLKFNRAAIEEPLAAAAAYLGIGGGYEGFCDFVDDLNDSLGVPRTLAELGVKNPDLDALTKDAFNDPSMGGNPVKMTAEDLRGLFEGLL